MSTVLTKPVLLDETGQAIVDKLEDIQLAIGGTGEFIPINIRVTTPPTKTSYLAGEALDLSGMVVTLVANNGGMYDVTGDCVFSPTDGSTVTSSTTEVNISYTWYKDSTVFTAVQPIGIKELASIAVTTPPTVTEYDVGDTLDLTGIVVTASYADGSTSDVTSDCVFSPADGDVLDASDTNVSITYTFGGITKTATQAIIAKAIYGASWDGTSTNLWTRTDAASNFTDPIPAVNNGTGSSPFDNLMPWSGIRVVEDEDAGTLVAIPKFWYRIIRDLGQLVKIQISNGPQEDFLVSPAHADRGDGQGERDVVYIGRYKCGPSYKSVNGQLPVGNSNRAGFRANIHNLGSTIWQQDFAMWWTIRMLYLVEFANWDSQSAIGYGCSPVEGTVVEMGYTDSMQYHTGTTAANRTTYGGTQYRHIEGLWDNRYEWCDGIYFSGSSIYCIKNPANFSDSSGGTSVGTRSTSSGIISGWTKPSASGFEYALFPSAVIASGKSYVSDKYNYNSSGAVLYGGGSSYGESTSGAFNLYGNEIASQVVSYIGSRLMKLPANA